MKSYFKIFKKVKNQAGATAVIVAIVLPMLIGFGALAVDVGYMHVTKNELQNVADAAALAATRKLGTIYQGMTPEAQQAYVCGESDIADIKGVADAVAHNNKAGGKHIIVTQDIEIGDWNLLDTPHFTAKYVRPDAVRVTARRDGSANGPIITFFAKIFGIDAVNVSADATAALTGQSISEPGEIELPLGISTLAAAPDRCDKDIKFSPTNEACAGWNTFFEDPSRDIGTRRILQGMIDGTVESPATTMGVDKLEFIGGNLSEPTFNELLLLFKDKGYDVKVKLDDAGNEMFELIDDVYKPIMVPAYTDDEGNPTTGHLDPESYPNVVPLLDSDGNPRLYPDGGAEGEYILSTPRNKHEWPTKVVVYYKEEDYVADDGTLKCSNPEGDLLIVGYAIILLTDVFDKTVIGNLECEIVDDEDTRGGGGDYGTKGSIPCLVE